MIVVNFTSAVEIDVAQSTVVQSLVADTCTSIKTHCGLVTPNGDKDLDQHWLRQWLAAWRHQAITWTNADVSSMEFCSIPQTTILQEALKSSIRKISF